jgi:hypothetical protein
MLIPIKRGEKKYAVFMFISFLTNLFTYLQNGSTWSAALPALYFLCKGTTIDCHMQAFRRKKEQKNGHNFPAAGNKTFSVARKYISKALKYISKPLKYISKAWK